MVSLPAHLFLYAPFYPSIWWFWGKSSACIKILSPEAVFIQTRISSKGLSWHLLLQNLCNWKDKRLNSGRLACKNVLYHLADLPQGEDRHNILRTVEGAWVPQCSANSLLGMYTVVQGRRVHKCICLLANGECSADSGELLFSRLHFIWCLPDWLQKQHKSSGLPLSLQCLWNCFKSPHADSDRAPRGTGLWIWRAAAPSSSSSLCPPAGYATIVCSHLKEGRWPSLASETRQSTVLLTTKLAYQSQPKLTDLWKRANIVSNCTWKTCWDRS